MRSAKGAQKVFALLVLSLFLVLLNNAVVSAQDDRSVFWNVWDVEIDNIDTAANRFDVREIYDISFNGSFSFGSAVIPRDNLESIDNIQVFEGGELLTQTCNEASGTYCVENSGNEVSITYYFQRPITNGRQTFEISYTVDGALRVYEEGDQLWWNAIPAEHFGFEIGSSTITVTMPEGFAPRRDIDPVVTYGEEANSPTPPTTVQVEGNRVIARATRVIRGDESLSIRVQYPHDPDARMAAWQPGFDSQRQFEESVGPFISLIAGLLALIIGIGGPLFILTQYLTRGRDPKIGPVPEYLSEPPSTLRPGVVGTLVDETADLRDIMSTLVDLANRGYVVIQEEKKEGLFGMDSSEFIFKRTDQSTERLKPFEQKFISGVFGGSRLERNLDDLKNKFYRHIPKIQEDLYQELVDEGLINKSPATTRNQYVGFGVGLFVLAIVGTIFVGSVLAETLNTPAIFCIPIALIAPAVMLMIAGRFMPAKTRKGAEEAAKWKAFREYLRNLENYTDAEHVKDKFDEYLPYTIAFGLNRAWMRRFRNVDNVPMPPWYYPTYLGGPYRRGYTAGSPISSGVFNRPGGVDIGDLARAGDSGGLDSMSGGLAQGLESMSDGLTSLLNSASSTMSSQPQSSGSGGSWSGGGGSFSGGGFSGGGGSGGGSRGFG